MPKQKYYYVVVDAKSKNPVQFTRGIINIRTTKKAAEAWSNLIYKPSYVVPILADSLHKLIKEHTKKAK